MIGQTISHYQILQKLGEGGMGVVYQARDTLLDRIVALKFLSQRVSKDDIEQTRFLQEAKAAAQLNHPNACTVYAIEEFEEQQFIAMEYVDGKTMRKHTAGHPLPTGKCVEYAIQIAGALQEAHSKGIVHRDIKPDNIMVNSLDQAKVMDFGLAKLKGALKLTRTSSTLGTIAYMSPEQIQGSDVDPRSDIFSFGILLYEMVAGRLPFRGEHEAAMVYSIVNEEPEPIQKSRADASPRFVQIIEECLHKDPADRPQSMREVLRQLRLISSAHVPVPSFVQATQEADRQKSTVLTGRKKVRRRSRIGLIIGAGIVVMGGLVYLFWSLLAVSSKPRPLSIAVLYLENLTSDKTYDAFASGMTDEIINELTNVPGLQVVSRTEVQSLSGKVFSVSEIGARFGVAYVFQGSVRVEAKRVRVTCWVIQTEDKFQFWSQAYTREMSSELDVQSDIAQKVGTALKTKFAQKGAEQKLGLSSSALMQK